MFAGCGPKSNEEKAKDVVIEHLRTSLPDFENNYEGANFGKLGTAYLPFEETAQYIDHAKAIKVLNDSISVLEESAKQGNTGTAAGLQVFRDSIAAKSDRNSTAKQSYVPEKIFKISHSYSLKGNDKLGKKTEFEFYIDRELTKVLKTNKVY